MAIGAVAATAQADSHRRSGRPDAEETEAVKAVPDASTGSCGVERWSVKTGIDADASKITLQSTTPTTIASLDAIPAPSSLPSNNRVQPTETTVFKLSATLTQYKIEADSDYHLVMSDSAGHTMIGEIPDPACVGSGSPLASSIQKARSEFDAKYTATGSFQAANVPVTVTGVGFFDFQHGQTGVAPNGIELHAVLDVQFGTGTTNSVAVTNPGNQTGAVGSPASLQVHATDSATGQTLTYAGTGLPAGLAINSNTGLVSGTPTAAGTSTATITATDSTGATGSSGFTWTITGGGASSVPRPQHVVVVMMENHSYADIIGSSAAPYINSLASSGASFTQSFAVTHPSEPNYLALFSGSTQGLSDDSCPHTYTGANLGSELIAKQLTFTGYSESMPSNGYTGCTSGTYARKHNPWSDFSNLPTASNLTFSSFPTDYNTLPAVSVVVPNLQNDMHDGTVAQGDTWLQHNIDGYAQWAKTHNSLLVLTWDEDDNSANNQIPTIFVGAAVKTGTYPETINHYTVLRTLEDAYSLPHAGASSAATPITDVWNTDPATTVTLTNPGSQAGKLGTAASLQLNASDTGTGQTLTYTATGLPTGLSINSGTGLISGTPSAAGSFSVTAKVTDNTGASGTATFSWTITGSGGGCSGQLLANPGFETGTASPWTGSAGIVSNSTSEPAHGGSWDAWLDGYGATHTDTLSQSITIPTGCHATLTYWLHIDTAETSTTKAYDTLTVTAGGTSIATYSNLDHHSGYTQRTIDLSSYAGRTLPLTFTGTEDYTAETSFVLDDATLTLH